MKKISISSIETEKMNPFYASEEELLAHALSEAGLLKEETHINGYCARSLCQAFFDKREFYKKSSKIGNMLVRKNIITEDQLKDALDYQNKFSCKKLGDAIEELGFCTKEDIHLCLNSQEKIRANHSKIKEFCSIIVKQN